MFLYYSYVCMVKRVSVESVDGGQETRVGEDLINCIPVKRLFSYVKALKKLTTLVAPPRVRLRAQYILLALYLTRDDSGSGFGSVLIRANGILYESRTWTTD